VTRARCSGAVPLVNSNLLNAEILDDVPGALWTRETIDMARRPVTLPGMQRVVVAVDPSGARGMDDEAADSIGIVVAALGADGRGYVLADRSCKLSPAGWARQAVEAYHEFKADRLIAERNFGGALCRAYDPHGRPEHRLSRGYSFAR
jgi:phage terminase large subunit-like protein